MALSKKKLSPWFLLALLLVLGWISLKVAGVFLNYILTALFLAYITHPAYDWLEKQVRIRAVAALLMVMAVCAVLLVPLAFIIVELVDELGAILRALDPATLQQQIDAIWFRFLEAIGQEGAADGGEGETGLLSVLLPGITSFVSSFASQLPGALAEAFIGFFVMIYVLYYAYQDGHAFVEHMRGIIPLQEAHRDLLMHEVGNVIQAVMYGHVLTALIQAVLASIGFLLFGVPNVIFWSALTFILALLPVVGPPLIWFPWGIALLLQGHTFEGIGLLVYSAIMVSSLDNIIRPKLIGDRAKVHPVVILIGVLGGIVVFGFSGLILGPLVLSIFVTILEVYRKEFAMRLDEDTAPA